MLLPSGCLLYCTIDDRVAGCIALRKIDDTTCEMKRLYLRPEFRGHGLGQVLITEILDRARKLGYRRMRLDTLPGMMDSAIRLYREFGFYETAPYYDNPNAGTLYMQIDL
jgi:putative acetyltransferase